MTAKPTDAAALMLGITKPQIAAMQKRIDTLERENDALALTRVRREIGIRLVEIRLLLRDGNLKGLNGGTDMRADQIKLGQRIKLDMGYGGATFCDELCTVIGIHTAESLFGDPVIRMEVRRFNGERMQVVDHAPADEVEVPEELT